MNASAPASATATVSSVVATGRSMKMRDGFMRSPAPAPDGGGARLSFEARRR